MDRSGLNPESPQVAVRGPVRGICERGAGPETRHLVSVAGSSCSHAVGVAPHQGIMPGGLLYLPLAWAYSPKHETRLWIPSLWPPKLGVCSLFGLKTNKQGPVERREAGTHFEENATSMLGPTQLKIARLELVAGKEHIAHDCPFASGPSGSRQSCLVGNKLGRKGRLRMPHSTWEWSTFSQVSLFSAPPQVWFRANIKEHRIKVANN